jgi:hypothetical protein
MRDAGAPCNVLSKAFKWTADLRAVEIFRASVVPGTLALRVSFEMELMVNTAQSAGKP